MATVARPLQENRNVLDQSLMGLFESCATGIFGPCEDTCQQASRRVFWEADNVVQNEDDRVRRLDYEKLHDQFLESMLHEAAAMGGERDEEEVLQSNCDPKLIRKQSSSLSTDESLLQNRKRRRPLRLTRRRTPPRIRNGRVSPLSDQNSFTSLTDSKSSSTSVTISLSELSKSNLPKSETYIHEHCRMQKDKGKGEPVGSNICAKGRDACLGKLREKMRLLTEVATEKATGASMKIRKARIAERVDNFVETRSLINLRMGFLSVTYGVLLRWDTTKTGTITLVVLRKMCHESFYPSEAQVPATVGSSHREVDDNALRKANTAEFIALEAPFHTPRPLSFKPARLSVSLVSVVGLAKKSHWTIQLSVGDTVENLILQWDTSKRFLGSKDVSSFQHFTGQRVRWNTDSALQIKLFENRLRRRMPRRLTCSMRLPLRRLHPQPSPARGSRITIPCSHDPEACVVLDIAWQSDYALWVAQELEARQRPPSPVSAAVVEHEESENQDPWDWICHVC